MQPGNAARLHARRGVHGVSPQVVAELLLADDAGHHRTGRDAGPDLETAPIHRRVRVHLAMHGEGHLEHRLHVVGALVRHAGDHHVGITDGLDLLEPMLPGQPVEAGEQLVEDLHHPPWFLGLCERREVDHVAEEHGHVGTVVCNQLLPRLEPLGDRDRQHVEQQRIGLRFGLDPFTVDVGHQPGGHQRRADQVDRQQQPGEVVRDGGLLAQNRVESHAADHQHDDGDERRTSRAGTEQQDRAQRCDEAPGQVRAGGDRSAQRDHTAGDDEQPGDDHGCHGRLDATGAAQVDHQTHDHHGLQHREDGGGRAPRSGSHERVDDTGDDHRGRGSDCGPLSCAQVRIVARRVAEIQEAKQCRHAPKCSGATAPGSTFRRPHPAPGARGRRRTARGRSRSSAGRRRSAARRSRWAPAGRRPGQGRSPAPHCAPGW